MGKAVFRPPFFLFPFGRRMAAESPLAGFPPASRSKLLESITMILDWFNPKSS
jgi:hypothetical protein